MDPDLELWIRGLRQGWIMRFQPLGGSMLPCLRQGDIVSICPRDSCRIGDIILTQKEEALVLHRMVARRNGRIITKGDSLGRLDVPVLPEQILGRAIAREREGRVRCLDHLGARCLGLAFSFTLALVPGLISLLLRLKTWLGRNWKDFVQDGQREDIVHLFIFE